MSDHSTLTGVDLHECKGADAASSGTVRVADGSGGGSWQKITTSQLDTSSIFSTNKLVLSVIISALGTAEKTWGIVPCACTLNTVYSVSQASFTTADATITIKNDGGSTAGTITVATAGSAAGDIDSVSCSANNTFTTGQRFSVETDGGGDGTGKLFVTLVFTVTGALT